MVHINYCFFVTSFVCFLRKLPFRDFLEKPRTKPNEIFALGKRVVCFRQKGVLPKGKYWIGYENQAHYLHRNFWFYLWDLYLQ